MNLRPIVDRLEAAGLGTFGKSLYINMMPLECPEGIVLRNKLAGTLVDYELPGFYRTKFQLVARSKSYDRGQQLMADAFTALTLQETQVGVLHVRYMRPHTLPVVFPLSKGNLLETAADFDIAFDQ